MAKGPAGSESDHLIARIEAVNRLLSSLRLLRDALATQPPEHFMDVLDLACRGAYVRQHEALEGHAFAAEHGHGHSTVLVIRPALEELLWLEYLATLEPDTARKLLALLTVHEVGRAVRAQQQHLGKKTMKQLGFPGRYVSESDRNLGGIEDQLVDLGERLGFTVAAPNGGKRWFGPSMGELADRSGQQALYQFLYSATSRTVHFSPAELARRSWFRRDGGTSITSSNFERYWADFGLTWGSELLVRTANTAVELLPSELDVDLSVDVLHAIENVMSLGRVPIVTPEELNLSNPSP